MALLVSSQANAQSVPTAPAPQAQSDAGVADIIVTAQRRSENVQKASLSIAAIGSKDLVERGVSDPQSLNGIVPGLKLTYTGNQVQMFVRGVGDVSANAYTQSSVSLNMDGVYVARSTAFGPIFFDTARVEVLRGPQGTLYGRNSSGGAINIISNAPDLSHTSGYGAIEIGNYNLVRGQAVANLPVSDSFGLRAAVQVTHRDGYLSDGSNDDKSQGGRLRALWEPTSTLTINLIGEAVHMGGRGANRVYRPALFDDPWTGPNDPRITPALYPTLNIRNRNSFDADYYGLTGQIDWDLGGAKLTVIPAFKSVSNRSNIDGDFLFDETDHSRQSSLEARLSGDTHAVKWVVGGYGFVEDLDVFVRVDQRKAATLSGQYQVQDIPKLNTYAGAAFGEATVSLTGALRLIGGVRYTEETRNRDGLLTTTNYTAGVAGTPSLLAFTDQRIHVGAVTWKGGAELDVAPASMLYATVSKGFKSGGFDATDPDPYRPEYVTAYTVGSKNRFFDNTLQLNLEGFYWKYRDQQTAFLGLDSRGITSFITRNAGQSTIYGADADIVWRPTRGDTLTLGAEYLHTRYDSFVFATPGATPAGTVLADGCVSAGPATLAGQFMEDCSGHPLPRAPKFTLNARYAHAFDLANGATVTIAGTAKHDSLAYLSPNYASPNFRQTAYGLFDADLTYTAPGGRWSLQAYIRNITDKAVYQTASTESSIPPTSGATRGSFAAIGAPRTFGGRFQVNF